MTRRKVAAPSFPLASHFTKPMQQIEAGKLGMWLFLATEVLLFGGLFTAYAVFLYLHPELFKEAHKFLDVKLGMLNTIVLLFSSLTVALSIHAAQQGKKKWIIINLVITLLCAATFLVIKYLEYKHKFQSGLLPGHHFANAAVSNPDQLHVYFGVYFMMTGLHGIHVVIGMIILSWLLVRTSLNQFSSQYYLPLELGGLYWHLVDLIWIFLFPLLYLIR